MKRLFTGFLISLFIITQCFGATGWVKGKPASSESPSDLSTLIGENNAAIDLAFQKYRQGCQMTYATAATLTVGSGGIIVSNSTGTVRLMLANAAAITADWTMIDTGTEEVSTTYNVFAIGSATTDTEFTIKISKSSAPSGVTYYRKLGSFYNDASGNIINISNDEVSTKYSLYDSGWFAVAASTTYTKTHNLGTTKAIVQIYVSENSDGSGWQAIGGNTQADQQCQMVTFSTTQIQIRTVNQIHSFYNAAGVVTNPTSGYARILLIALE